MPDIDLGAAGVGATPSQAAAQALAATPRYPNALSRDPALHLLRRAAFGPTPADLAAVRAAGLDAWIEQQLGMPADPVGDAVLSGYPLLAMDTAQLRKALPQYGWDAMWQLGHATIGRQVWSSRQLYEVMVDFWANHLNVTNPYDQGWDNRTVYDRQVIRPHALGRFSDLLLASARSPAMLRYLDNASSHKRAVNENYGRELLELHTVGVSAGYTESDVRGSAYLLTGRTVGADGLFRYDPDRHWTGAVKVLGFTHANASASGGLAAGDAYLTYLANHPATAASIARKLAVRFVCDNPPAALVARLAAAYRDNRTAIAPVLRVLLRSREFWISTGLKTRRPLENLVATVRAAGVTPGADTPKALEGFYWMADNMGQRPMAWAPPNGYPDVAPAWLSANGTLTAWNCHRAVANTWYQGLTYTPLAQLVPGPPTTVGALLDGLAGRLLFQPLRAEERAALLTYLRSDTNTPVASRHLQRLTQVVPLLFDTIYHGLR